MSDVVDSARLPAEPAEQTTAPTTDHATVHDVCGASDVPIDRGVAALVDGVAIAVFRLSPASADEPEEWFAIAHHDPVTGAPVMARGLVGSVTDQAGPVPTVASPLHKQRYNLRTGQCLDDPTLSVSTFPVRITNGRVRISVP
ncbi:MAG: nitrite reductase small subunit NirD [Actinomycetota bacterium]